MYSIYNQTTGQILKNVQTDNIQIQILNNENYVEGYVDDSIYYIENNVPVEIPLKTNEYSVFDFNTKQWVLDQSLAINAINEQRKQLLYASDWTQIPNGPLTTEQQAAWATYRQELRDIPSQSGYPFNVIWPTPPQG